MAQQQTSLLLLAVVLFVSIFCFIGETVAKVTSLTSNDLQDDITPPHFVKFFAPWCGHCKRMAEAWEELSESKTSPIIIAEVDCTVETALCSQHSISGYPTLKYFSKNTVVTHKGGRTIGALKHFISEQLVTLNKDQATSEDVVYEHGLAILNDANFNGVVRSGFSFIKFYAPWCGHCKKMKAAWMELASEYLNTKGVTIGEVDCTVHKGTCQKVDIKGYPTLLTFNNGKRVAKYSGGRTLSDFVKYVEEQRSTIGNNDGDEEQVVVVNGLTILTDATIQTTIKQGWSFVKFYAPWCGHCKRLEPTWKELASRFENDPHVRIAKVDCTVHQATCKEHKVNGYPSLVIFNNGAKLEDYTGARDLDSLADYFTAKIRSHDEL